MKKTITLFLLLCSFSLLKAQQMKVSGTVKDESGSGIPGANILIKGTTQGTITDLDGNYSLQVPASDTLVFSFIGYTTQRIPVNGQSVINVVLKETVSKLDEVVVVGYGTVKKSDLTGSVSSVKGTDLTKITSSSPEQSLQGKVAGVQVTSTSGAPGASPVVRIRGVGTFNNSSPIYVVDGVILDDISFLNSNDIASMEVLKDASATAIYGSRGANGVIIVTTKSGQAGEGKTTFSYSGEYGLQKISHKIDLLNGKEFAIISNEIRTGTYNNVDALPNTDWQNLIFNVAPVQNHQFSVSGSTKQTQYYFSLGYYDQDGIINKSSYKRLSVKLNNTYHLTDHLKLGNNLTVAPFKQRNAPNVTYAAYRAQPVLKPYYDDGSFGVVYNVGNPLADLANSNNYNKGIRGVGNVYAEATFLNMLTAKSSFGIDASYSKSENFTPAYTVYNPDGSASQQQNVFSDLFKGTGDKLNWLWENTLTLDKTVGKHYINAVVGYTMQNSTSSNSGISGQNVVRDDPNFWYIRPSYIVDPATGINSLNSLYDNVDPSQYYSMISYLFRANYTYSGKYLFTATFRRDGSSKFAKGNRYSNFPSFAAGWNIYKEDFMKDISLISNLKLRASWGKIGNEKIPYADRYAIAQSGLLTVFGINQAGYPATTYGSGGNPDLKWETTTQTDAGLEIGLFNNRLTGEFDYYHRKTEDILILLSVPGYKGIGQGGKIRFNAASALNRGVEYNLTWRQKVGEFSYSIGALGSTVHNEVLAVGGNSGIDSTLIDGYLGNGIPVTLSRKGLPIGAFYGYKTDGIFQTQAELDAYPHDSQAGVGDLRFVDVNKDGAITGEDRTYIGSPIPTFIFGFNVTMEYKGFDFSLDIQGQTGNKIFNGKEVVRPDPYNFEQHVMNRWTGPGTSNTEPRPSFGGYNYTPSDKFIQDGSFMRLRNLSLGYTLPARISDKLYASKLRVYIKGNNIYTLTKFTGYTPEIGGDVLSSGIDNGIYPVTSSYSIGLNVTF